MADYVTLLGAEEVSRAARNMQQAADTMQAAAGNLEHALERALARFNEYSEQHLARLEALVARDEAVVDRLEQMDEPTPEKGR